MTVAGREAAASATLDAARLRQAASAITAAIRSDDTTRDQVIALLTASSRLPVEHPTARAFDERPLR